VKHIGIHLRLLVAVFLLIGSTTFVTGYIGVTMTYEFVESRFEERIFFLAKYLALNSELGILIDERNMLGRLAKNLLSEKDIVRVTIFNDSDDILADELRPVSGELSVVEVPVVLKEPQEDSLTFDWTEAPEENEMIGKVKITYSTEGINRLLSSMQIRYMWFAIGLAAFSGVIFYFISRSLVSPVTQLAAAALRIANGDLEFRVKPVNLPEIHKLVNAFNVMLDSLQDSRSALEIANQKIIRQETLAELGKFSLMIAHEVKNPLSIIKSSMDMLKKDLPSLPDNLMISFIEDEIRRLNRLIEEFLTFARPARPSLRPVEIVSTVKECVDRLELQTDFQKYIFKLETENTPVYVNADRDLIMRAVSNLLKNALDAVCDSGTIWVRTRTADNLWICEIEDNGPGIPLEEREKIFEPFFTTRAKGTGLGLAFVSQVIQAHNGGISVESGKCGGALFRIQIPLTAKETLEMEDPKENIRRSYGEDIDCR
jgi:signal transduction histidine kinase